MYRLTSQVYFDANIGNAINHNYISSNYFYKKACLAFVNFLYQPGDAGNGLPQQLPLLLLWCLLLSVDVSNSLLPSVDISNSLLPSVELSVDISDNSENDFQLRILTRNYIGSEVYP